MWEILSSLAVGMLRDKNAVCFGSYGWSGEGIRYLAARLKDLGCTVLNTLAVKLKPGEEEFVQARNLAIELMDSID